MPQSRLIQGVIAFPDNAGEALSGTILIEVRDVSLQDQASCVMAQTTLKSVAITPGGHVPFELQAPAVASSRSLAMRVQVSMHADKVYVPGDFLSTTHIAVPAEGDVSALVVPVTKL